MTEPSTFCLIFQSYSLILEATVPNPTSSSSCHGLVSALKQHEHASDLQIHALLGRSIRVGYTECRSRHLAQKLDRMYVRCSHRLLLINNMANSQISFVKLIATRLLTNTLEASLQREAHLPKPRGACTFSSWPLAVPWYQQTSHSTPGRRQPYTCKEVTRLIAE